MGWETDMGWPACVTDQNYMNGREANHGDPVVQLDRDCRIVGMGLVRSEPSSGGNVILMEPCCLYAWTKDCLHVDDVAKILRDAGLGRKQKKNDE